MHNSQLAEVLEANFKLRITNTSYLSKLAEVLEANKTHSLWLRFSKPTINLGLQIPFISRSWLRHSKPTFITEALALAEALEAKSVIKTYTPPEWPNIEHLSLVRFPLSRHQQHNNPIQIEMPSVYWQNNWLPRQKYLPLH